MYRYVCTSSLLISEVKQQEQTEYCSYNQCFSNCISLSLFTILDLLSRPNFFSPLKIDRGLSPNEHEKQAAIIYLLLATPAARTYVRTRYGQRRSVSARLAAQKTIVKGFLLPFQACSRYKVKSSLATQGGFFEKNKAY